MKKDIRVAFNKIMQGMAAAYGVENMTQKFTVAPSIEQTLQDQITEQSTFLGMVHTQIVDHGEGETIYGGWHLDDRLLHEFSNPKSPGGPGAFHDVLNTSRRPSLAPRPSAFPALNCLSLTFHSLLLP